MSEEVVPANNVSFKEFCSLLNTLHKRKKQRQEQDKILSKFINDIKVKASQTNGKKNCTLFPILRLLLPKLERERKAYELKEAKLGMLLVKVLSLCKESADAKKLLNYRSVSNAQDNDFASVAYFLLKNRLNSTSDSFTIGDINNVLDKISSAEVGKKASTLDEAFSYVINKASPDQVKWFLRLILKDLKLEIGTNRILSVFHPDAPEFYEKCANLSKICEELGDGDERPLELGIQLFLPVSSMLSERLDVKCIGQLSADKTYHIENKFDGERFQMHMENGKFEYFSRRGHPYSKNYGSSYDSGLLTPKLKVVFNSDVASCILDGEMMGWHKEHRYFGSKGMAFDIKKITENSKYQPCFCVFDILYYNGKSLVGPPEKGGLQLRERLSILDRVFKDVPGVIQHSQRQIVKQRSEILVALNKAIEDEDEGIVVKDLDSYYVPNRRSGWYKIKPEYTDGTMSDLDLVIIGADFAENKKQGRAKSFLVACADGGDPENGIPPERWVCIGRVATGFSFDERNTICVTLERHWQEYNKTPAPPHLVFNKETPDLWVLPEHSVVLTVRASELIRSTDFGAEYTLRFPRVQRVRHDKPVNDVMTLYEFKRLISNKGPVVKLSTNTVVDSQMSVVPRKRKAAQAPQVAEQFKISTSRCVEATSKALSGRKICILSDDEDCSRQELVKIIESHGGRAVANTGADTFCCIAGRMTHRVRSIVSSQCEDVCSSQWLRSLPPSPLPCSLHPLYALSLKSSTKLSLARHYDAFGDCYTEETDVDMLRQCLLKMDEEEPIYITPQEMSELDKELFEDHNPYSFLRPCIIHFPYKSGIFSTLAEMYAATLCTDTSQCTHIVLPMSIDEDKIEHLKKNTKALIVTEDWLEECLLKKKLVSEESYIL